MRGAGLWFYGGVVAGERRRMGVDLLIAPWRSYGMLEFNLVRERVEFLCLQVWEKLLL